MPSDALLRVHGLGKSFALRRGRAGTAQRRWALQDVSFELARGRMLGLVGASGAGKSTLARCLALLEQPDCGEIHVDGRLAQAGDVQLIPQEPAASFNPRFTRAEAVVEPLEIQRRGTRQARRDAALQAMESVGLRADEAFLPVMASSGGERQRLAIARALTLEPKVLILDESLSGSDPAVQQQVLGLLDDLRRRRRLTHILISHDLMLVGQAADEIAVMDEGLLVEWQSTADLLRAARHPRTRELVEANFALSEEGPPL